MYLSGLHKQFLCSISLHLKYYFKRGENTCLGGFPYLINAYLLQRVEGRTYSRGKTGGPRSLGSWDKEGVKSETPFPELRMAASVLILKMSLKLSLPSGVHVSHPPIYVQAMLKYRKASTFLKVCGQSSTCKTKMVCENIWFPLSSYQSVF